MEDAKFVRRIAEKLGFVCETGHVNVAIRMEQCGESMETAARNLRHRFFGECVRKYRCSRILLAHHADDQAETALWNLMRGSHGLKGMREEQSLLTETGVTLELIRPLLQVRRSELVAWLTSHGHRWREDASNAEPVAVRNRLRNEALPLLAEISQRDVAMAFARGASDADEVLVLEAWALDQARVFDPQGRLHLPALRGLPVVLQRIALRKFLRDHGVKSLDRALIERGLCLLDVGNAAVVNLPGGGQLRRRAGRLSIELAGDRLAD